jgi:phytoene dehydrogenase-like protein
VALQEYDIAIIGAGGNGLTAAAYLARAGARVVVLEARFERGGTLASDDYSTPFTYNLAQLLLPIGVQSPPYRDLELAQHAVSFIEPDVAFSITLGGDELLVGRGGSGLGSELEALLAEASRVVAPLIYQPAGGLVGPGSVNGGQAAVPGLAALTPADVVRAAASDERAAAILRYACGMLGFTGDGEQLGTIGAYALARLFEPILVAGGSKGLANGLFRAAARAGARCLVSARVVAIRPHERGLELRLADGRRIRSDAVVSTLDPITTFLGLLGPECAGEVLTSVAKQWRLDRFGSFTAHFGIRGDPAGFGAAVIQLVGFDSADDVADHLRAADEGRLPPRPAGHVTVTTRHDPLQASPGPYGPLHTLRYETPAPSELLPAGAKNGDSQARGAGESPFFSDRGRLEYRERCWDTLADSAPALRDVRRLFQFADSPLDLERRFTTARRGSIRQGSLRPEQTLAARPHASCADGRTPIPGLYLGGGSIHPGVPGSLGGGHNVAAIVCADLGFERWWPAPAPVAQQGAS